MISHDILAEVAAFAEECDYPCTKQDLLDIANEEQASDEVLDVLEEIPNREYQSETDLVEAAQMVTV